MVGQKRVREVHQARFQHNMKELIPFVTGYRMKTKKHSKLEFRNNDAT